MAKSKLPTNKLPTTKAVQSTISDRPGPYKPSKQELDRDRRYKAEDACRDIERAEVHKQDKALMSDVRQIASEKIDSLKRIK